LRRAHLAASVAAGPSAEVAGGDGGGDLGDVAPLGGEVAGHGIDAVGQVFPGAGHALDVSLPAELTLVAHFTGHAGDLSGKGTKLIDHRIDGVFQLQNFPLHIDGDLAGQVAVGDGGGDLGDVAHLGRQIARHHVDAVGQISPGASDPFPVGLPAELALGADLAGDAGDLGGERAKLVHHRVDRVLQFEDLALDVDGDFLGQVASGDGLGDVGDVADL